MDETQPPRNLLRYATVGLEFFLTFLLFLGAGWLLDQWLLGGKLGFFILGGIIGFAAGFYRITRQGWGILKSAQKEHEEQARQRKKARPRRSDKNQ
jgi:F0F1-type ATP synthase assembly protein I